jgi:hypothetical protein
VVGFWRLAIGAGRADVSEANASRAKVTPFARRPEKVPWTAFFRFD